MMSLLVSPKCSQRLADVFADVRGERDDVVIERALEFAAARDAECRLGLHLLEVHLGHEPLAAKRLGGEQLDLQPDLEFALFSPDVPHLGTGVASYHPPTG